MNTEEKARAYDEALERAKQVLSNNCTEVEKLCLECIFPELTESEDERNWKSVERAIRGFITNPTDADELLAWLEKQKDSKVVKFDHFREQKPAEWSEEDEAIRSWCISDIERAKYCKSQTKPELCDIEINWLKNLPERFNPQPKQEWREEDRDAINGAIRILLDDNNPNFVFPEHSKLSVGEIVKRLKSLCPSWKPNNEQMKALHAASSVSSLGEYVQTHLWSLYNDLQKLM